MTKARFQALQCAFQQTLSAFPHRTAALIAVFLLIKQHYKFYMIHVIQCNASLTVPVAVQSAGEIRMQIICSIRHDRTWPMPRRSDPIQRIPGIPIGA